MRRTRNGTTKVWHNPDLELFGQRRGPAVGPKPTGESKEEQRKHRAALEALFSPRRDVSAEPAPTPTPTKVGRIVLAPPPQSDPKAVERQKLLSKLLGAEGRPGISKAANDFLRAGFAFPNEQDVHLQLLEHSDEGHVRAAIETLSSLLVGELPKRRAVLDSRLRRIEEFAEEAGTRDAAKALRRQVAGRGEGLGSPARGR